MRALGRALGVSQTAANRYTQNPTWPFGPGPWKNTDVPAMERWRDALPGRVDLDERGSAREDEVTLTDAKIRNLKASAMDREFKLLVQRKKYHSTDDCKRRRLAAIHHAKQELLAIPDGLPVDEDIKTLVQERIEEVLTRFANGYGSGDEAT